jgi:hypothetical protein
VSGGTTGSSGGDGSLPGRLKMRIKTKFVPATNKTGEKIKASALEGSITVEFNPTNGAFANHVEAAKALVRKLNHPAELLHVQLENDGFVFLTMYDANIVRL